MSLQRVLTCARGRIRSGVDQERMVGLETEWIKGSERAAESSTDCGFWMQLLGFGFHTIRVTDYLPFVRFIDIF